MDLLTFFKSETHEILERISEMEFKNDLKDGAASSAKFKNVQFWISDLLKTFSEQNECAHEWISSVGILGTVTDSFGPSADDYQSNRPWKYDLDDGTGVIKVVYFPKFRRLSQTGSSFDRSQQLTGKACCNSGLLSLLNRTESLSQSLETPFPIGSCVEAKGKVQFFRGSAELLAFQVRLVSNPQQEVERTLRLCNINKKEIYPNWNCFQ